MKRIKTIITIMLICLLFGTTIALAVTGTVLINGDSKVKPGEEKSLKIKISSDELVGVLSGKIETSSNMENVTITALNGWNLTHNPQTGAFNIYKAEGSKSEEIIEIKYTASKTEGTAKITLSELNLTTTNYETIQYQDVVKNITIANEDNQNNNEENNEEQNNQVNNDVPELNIIGNEENNQTNNTQNNQIGNNTDNTTSDEKIPQTGEDNYILISIAAIVILSVIFYIKYMQYRKNV